MPAHIWIDASDDHAGTASLIATASALAPTAAHAEVAAKIALLRGFPAALRFVEAAWTRRRSSDPATQREHPAASYGDEDIAFILILGTGVVVCSANI